MDGGLAGEGSAAAAAARAAAQWLLGAFAAVLAVILGGVQFGALYRPPDETAAAVAGVSVVVAVAATLGTIVLAGSLLVDGGITVGTLIESESRARARFRLRPRRRTDLTESATEIDPFLSRVVEVRSATRLGKDSPTALRDLLRRARMEGDSALADDASHDLRIFVEAGNWIHFSRRFARLKWAAVVASVVVTASAMLGAHAVSSAVPASTSVAAPLAAELIFDGAVDRAGLELGRECDATVVDVVIIGGTLTAPTIVTRPTPKCAAVLIEKADRFGIIIPK